MNAPSAPHSVDAGAVGPVARALGYAGLLPQVVAALLIAVGQLQVGIALAVGYPLLILSFLGGTWWGFAMRRIEGQSGLALLGVAPTLIGMAFAAILLLTVQVGWVLVAIGSVVLLTLLVDRRLVRAGIAPGGWMGLRVPLSIGLGVLTIVAGALAGAPRVFI